MTTLRICLSLLAANVRGELQYRVNFLIMVLTGVVWDGTAFVVIWVTLTRFHTIGGWSLGELTFLYGLTLFEGSITTLIFSFSQGSLFEWTVREGHFDRYLVRPLPPLLQLISSRLHVPILGSILGGATLFLVANTMVRVDWSPAAVTYLVLTIVGACLLQSSIYLLFDSLVFRLLSLGMLFAVIGDFARYGNYPLKIYSVPMRLLLTFVLPLAFMGYFPAAVLLNRTGEISLPPIFAYLTPLAGVLWFVPAYLLFHREMRNYQSSGT
jgi:ABC-2 type transport system permease protein